MYVRIGSFLTLGRNDYFFFDTNIYLILNLLKFLKFKKKSDTI